MRAAVNPAVAARARRGAVAIVRLLSAVALVVLVAGCSSPTSAVSDKKRQTTSSEPSRARVLLMPSDVMVSQITFADQAEPNAAWTAAAKGHVDRALVAMLDKQGAKPISYRPKSPNIAVNEEDLKVVKKHEAVRTSISVNKFTPDFSLPTRQSESDWGLGPEVAGLRRAYNAEYAIFTHLHELNHPRDNSADARRVAQTVLSQVVSALLGLPAQATFDDYRGTQTGFVSLVDLNTGKLIWFNFLDRNSDGLQNESVAQQAISSLFEGFPL